MNEPASGRLRIWLIAVIVFGIASIAFTLPAIGSFEKSRPAPIDAVEKHPNILIGNDVSGFQRELELATAALDEGRIYFPVSDFDCPVTFLLPGAIARRETGCSPMTIMNGFTVAAFFLNGLFAFGFLRALYIDWRYGVVLALAYEGCNFVAFSQHMGHMNYVQLEWIALAFWTVAGLCRPGANWGWALLLGLAMGLQMLTSPGLTLYLGLVGLPAFCVGHWWVDLRRGSGSSRLAIRFLLQALLAIAITGFVSAFYLSARLAYTPQKFSSPTWLPYVLSNYLQLLDPSHPTLFVGLPVFVLGILGANWWWFNRTARATACLVTAIGALAMMVPAVPGTPHWVMYHLVPPIQHTRVPTRFLPIALLATLGLAGQYLTAITAKRPLHCWLLAAGLFGSLIILNWFTSSWYYPIDSIPTVKGWLGKN